MIQVSKPCIGVEELEAIKKVFDSRWLGLGAVVKEFEDKVANFIKAPRFLATNTGTSAIHLALRAANIGKNDQVIVPSFTFVATVQAITAAGATPVFCDVEENSLNIDIKKIRNLITPHTKAIIPVHYRGFACDMNGLLDICNEHNLLLIEDAAHAFGSKYQGKYIGSFGHITCFSFDPIKNLTTGEGGGIVFQNEELHKKAEKMRILGIDKDTWSRYQNKRTWQYDVLTEGYRYHMPNFAAAIGLEQLKKFAHFADKRIEISKIYDEAFKNLEKIKILKNDYENTVPFMYVVLAKRREEFINFLKVNNVGSGIHYLPAHEFSFYKNCKSSDLSITKKISRMNTTIPLFVEMTTQEIQTVIDVILKYEEA